MRLSIRQASCAWALVLIACSLAAQTPAPHYTGNSPRAFIEAFYAWYGPRALAEDTTAGWNATLRLIRKEISPNLAKLLDEDAAAQAQCKELVGLDYDPFLGTQEPAERYEIGKISQAGEYYRANVYRVVYGKRNKEPDVIAEFTRKGRRWLLVNFYYPPVATDLLAELKSRLPCSVPRVPH